MTKTKPSTPSAAKPARKQAPRTAAPVAEVQEALAAPAPESVAPAAATAAVEAAVIAQPLDKPEKIKKPAKLEKAPKLKKVKLVRDSYAMPEAEYAQIGALKKRLLALGRAVKKSELLRGGIATLVAFSDAELLAAMSKVERIKTGRPAN